MQNMFKRYDMIDSTIVTRSSQSLNLCEWKRIHEKESVCLFQSSPYYWLIDEQSNRKHTDLSIKSTSDKYIDDVEC